VVLRLMVFVCALSNTGSVAGVDGGVGIVSVGVGEPGDVDVRDD